MSGRVRLRLKPAIAASGGGTDTLITSFDVTNWDSVNTSPGFIRKPLAFKAGDMPMGSVPVLKVAGVEVDAQFDERSTWPADGSLRLCVAHIRDSQFAAAATRSYDVYRRTGSFSNTGSKSLSDITGSEDFKVELSSFTQYDGSTTTTRGTSAALASFNMHSATATRVTKVHEGDVCEGWEIWGMFADGSDGSGTEDAHLQAIWHVDIWKNADGSIADIEYCAVLAQQWWSIASKYQLNYTAVLKNGATTIATYASSGTSATEVQHPYRSQWATVRTANDNGHGRRHWKTAMPTLFTTMDKAYWISTGLIPPLDTSFTPLASSAINSSAGGPYTSNYLPCGAQNHRAAIDGTGSYQGRGLMPNTDCVAFMRQTAEDIRYARTNAFAGLHIPYHYRSNNTRTRSGETADTANTVISAVLLPQLAADYTFTADGMPAPVEAFADSRTSASFQDGYVQPLGGNGIWAPSGDSSHAVNYSYFMYLLEGERYFMQATLDLATKCLHGQVGGSFGGRPPLLYAGNPIYQAAFSIPTTTWSGIANMTIGSNSRAVGWAHMLLGSASGIVPDDDPQCNYIRAYAAHNANYCATSLPYMPDSQKASGWYKCNDTENSMTVGSPWFNNFICQGAYHHYLCTGDTNAKALGDFTAKLPIQVYSQNMNYLAASYKLLLTPKQNVGWDPSTNDWFNVTTDAYRVMETALTAATSTFAYSSLATRWSNFEVANGDEVYPSTYTDHVTETTIPAELTQGTKYFVVNADAVNNTFQLSATLGGSAISFATDQALVYFGVRIADFNHAIAVNPPDLPLADDYPGIAYAALAMANHAGNADATNILVDAAETFLGNVDQSKWVTWKFKRAA